MKRSAVCEIIRRVWRRHRDDLRFSLISYRQHKTKQSESCLWCFRFDSFLASVCAAHQTQRQTVTLQTEGSWVKLWISHGERRCQCTVNGGRRRMSSHDMTERRKDQKERKRGNNSSWCKVQIWGLSTQQQSAGGCLTLAAAQSNMPLCWRGSAMGMCFFSFFWPRHWLGMLSWAGGGYSNVLSDAKIKK